MTCNKASIFGGVENFNTTLFGNGTFYKINIRPHEEDY